MTVEVNLHKKCIRVDHRQVLCLRECFAASSTIGFNSLLSTTSPTKWPMEETMMILYFENYQRRINAFEELEIMKLYMNYLINSGIQNDMNFTMRYTMIQGIKKKFCNWNLVEDGRKSCSKT